MSANPHLKYFDKGKCKIAQWHGQFSISVPKYIGKKYYTFAQAYDINPITEKPVDDIHLNWFIFLFSKKNFSKEQADYLIEEIDRNLFQKSMQEHCN